MKPLVSVIMPAYNAELYIEEAVRSVLNQSYTELEVIVVDDCSTDRTVDRLKNIKSDRLKVYHNENNAGIAYTTNRCIKFAKGRYFALLDDDDIAEPERLELQVDYLEKHSDIAILGGRTTWIDENGAILKHQDSPRVNPRYFKALLLFQCVDFMNSTAMIRSEFIKSKKLFFRDNCYGMQDYRFYMEASKVGNISTIDRFLLRHRIQGKNQTDIEMRDHGKERAEAFAKFQKDSLTMSGFKLEADDYIIFHRIFAEENEKCRSLEELKKVYQILQNIVCQGRRMGIDYVYELEHLCKKKYTEQIMKFDIFG